MPKSRKRKNHKKKVTLRNKKINETKSKIEKLQREFIMDLINKEKESGKFENTKPIDAPVIEDIRPEDGEVGEIGPQI